MGAQFAVAHGFPVVFSRCAVLLFMVSGDFLQKDTRSCEDTLGLRWENQAVHSGLSQITGKQGKIYKICLIRNRAKQKQRLFQRLIVEQLWKVFRAGAHKLLIENVHIDEWWNIITQVHH